MSTDWASVNPDAADSDGYALYDPATAYGIRIVQREVVAPDKVVKVYERHLDDLDRASQPGSGLLWQPKRLQRFINFCRQVCRIPDRHAAAIVPLELLPVFEGAYGLLLGWTIDNPTRDPSIDPLERAHGSARYRTMLMETPKHSGKTPTAAAFVLYNLAGQLPPPAAVGDPEDDPVVFIGTDLEDQNKVIRGYIDRMIEHPYFGPDGIGVRFVQGQYTCETTNAICMLRSAEGRGRGTSGFAPSLMVYDEVQDWSTMRLRDNLAMGMGKRTEARAIYNMNAGTRDVSAVWPERAKAGRIADGITTDDTYLPMIWGVDSRDDPLESEDSWPKAYPTLEVTVERATVIAAANLARTGSSLDRSNVLRLNFGVWARAVSEDWLDYTIIEKCFVPSRPERDDWADLPCVVGLDLSRSSDLTGYSTGWWLPDGSVWCEADGYTCRRGVGKIRSKAEDLDIDLWIRERDGLQLADTLRGESIDYEPIARRLIEFSQSHNLRAVAIDSYSKERFYDELERQGATYTRDTAHSEKYPIAHGGLVFVEHPNTKYRKPVWFAGGQKDYLYIHDTIERMGQRISEGTIGFLDKAALAWNFGCIQVQRSGESMVMMKKDATEVMAGRIDIVAATFYCLGVGEKILGQMARQEDPAARREAMREFAELMRGA